MSLPLTSPLQDTTVVEVARDGLALVSAWTMIGMALAFVAILVVLVLVLAELRGLSRAWTGFLTAAGDRSRPLLEHAGNAARNVDHVTGVVRSEVDRLNETIGSVANDVGELGEASVEVKRRLADLSALLDLAQSEAEDAVLDVAAKVRMLRRGAGLLGGLRGGGGGDSGDVGGRAGGGDAANHAPGPEGSGTGAHGGSPDGDDASAGAEEATGRQDQE